LEKSIIRIEGLSFAYNEGFVLENVNFTVERGDFAAIVGPNGGGKTTLLKLILGLFTPQRGSVRVFEHLPREVSPSIGYLPQNAHFDPRFPVTVTDVVLMGRLKKGLMPGFYSRRDKEAAQAALDEVDLYPLRKKSFSILSGGQRQRTLIARILAAEPEILLLDEPTASLDLQAEKELYELLRKLNERLTVVMVSHDVFFVSRFVNKVICVKGSVRVHPTSEISDELVGELYGRELRAVRHSGHDKEGLEP
jgi:zinc transport system ATP-binding protein